MRLRRVLKNKMSGFTLLEILIVFGITGVVFSMTPLFDMVSVGRNVQRNVYSVLTNTLIKSRSIAMRTHMLSGVSFLSLNHYVLFVVDEQGEDIVLDTILTPTDVSVSSECERIVFDTLGRTEKECGVLIIYGTASTSVMIGYEGYIE